MACRESTRRVSELLQRLTDADRSLQHTKDLLNRDKTAGEQAIIGRDANHFLSLSLSSHISTISFFFSDFFFLILNIFL